VAVLHGLIPDECVGIAILTYSPGGTRLRHDLSCGWIESITGETVQLCLLDQLEKNAAPAIVAGIVMTMILLLLRKRLSRRQFDVSVAS